MIDGPDVRVAAAIDFGTHSTGYAWATIDPANDDPTTRKIKFRTQWPGQPVPAAKNLSALLLTDTDTVVAWGHQARRAWSTSRSTADGTKLRYHYAFKLGLKPGIYADQTLSEPMTIKQATDLTTRYLREIYRAAVEDISSSGYVEEEIRWCLTVPAIWGDYEKQLTLRAAVAAGLPGGDRMLLAIEPEAAAVHCRIRGAQTVAGRRTGDALADAEGRFMVVDCGGGTVDITAYSVDADGGMEEIGHAAGGALGSEYVNDAFTTEVLADRLGGVDRVVELQALDAHALLDLIQAWEQQKLTVSAFPDPDQGVRVEEPVYVSLSLRLARALEAASPGWARRQVTDDAIVVAPEEVARLFESVVPGVLVKVDEQLAAINAQCGPRDVPETILLVGGFAQCSYLRWRLHQHVGDRARVLVPPDGAEAVLSGAVHFCYTPSVIRARRTKYTYGLRSGWTYEQGVDEKSRKYVNGYGKAKVLRFQVAVRADETVPADHEVVIHQWAQGPAQETMDIAFLASADHDPRYPDEATIIGTLSVDMTSTSNRDLPSDERKVTIYLKFGGTHIKVRAVDLDSNKEVTADLRFDCTFVPNGQS